jgi:hypothetical protein
MGDILAGVLATVDRDVYYMSPKKIASQGKGRLCKGTENHYQKKALNCVLCVLISLEKLLLPVLGRIIIIT